jgi:hypothetical protein
VSSALKLVYRGQITAEVGLAPFQYAPSNPLLYYPTMMNPSGLFGGQAANSDGIFGLCAMYASICPWSVMLSGTTVGTNSVPVQFASACITPGGVFDFDATLPNPAQYYEVGTTANNRWSAYGQSWQAAIYPGMHIVTSAAAVESDVGQLIYDVPIPTLLFVDTKQPLYIAGAQGITNNEGSWFRNQRLSLFNFGSEFNPLFNATDGLLKGLPKQLCYDIALQKPAEIDFFSLVLVPTYFSNSVSQSSYSLVYDNHLYFGDAVSNVVGLAACPGTGFLVVPNPGTPSPLVFFKLSMSDATDQSAIAAASLIQMCQTPGGHFFISAAKGAVPHYYIIFGDLSGYYRVTFQGNSAAAIQAISVAGGGGGGFGIDLAGNFWVAGGYQSNNLPLLYSTLRLAQTLVLGTFPTLAAGGPSMLCTPGTPCEYEWEG